MPGADVERVGGAVSLLLVRRFFLESQNQRQIADVWPVDMLSFALFNTVC